MAEANEERKSAGNLNNYLQASSGGSLPSAGGANDTEQAYYSDLMDLIYTNEAGGDPNSPDGQPTVGILEEEASSLYSSATEPQALPFVTVSANGGELEISTEAMELLDGMQHRKIAVVAICGSKNAGKSFLANKYLGRMQGFKTRGLLG